MTNFYGPFSILVSEISLRVTVIRFVPLRGNSFLLWWHKLSQLLPSDQPFTLICAPYPLINGPSLLSLLFGYFNVPAMHVHLYSQHLHWWWFHALTLTDLILLFRHRRSLVSQSFDRCVHCETKPASGKSNSSSAFQLRRACLKTSGKDEKNDETTQRRREEWRSLTAL